MSTALAIKGKADQVMERIEAWLREGKLAVGDKLPSERELAGKFGVSLLTVNKAMSRLEDAGMLNRSAGRGTHVAKLPANDAIAVVCDLRHIASPDHSPYIDVLVDKLLAGSKKSGVDAHFLIGRGESAEEFLESLNLESAIWSGIKGVISRGWREGFEERLLEIGIPSVIIGAWDQGLHAILPDYEELGRIAALEAVKAKARRLCAVYREECSESPWNNPMTPFKELEAKGEAPFELVRLPTNATNPAESEAFAKGALKDLASCDALFFSDDNLAAGFARLFERKPELQPRLVLSHANKGASRPLPGSFKTISFDVGRMAAEALRSLTLLRRGEEAPRRLMVKPELES